GPLKPPPFRLRSTTDPTLPGRSEAPISAMDCGWNRASRLRMLMAVGPVKHAPRIEQTSAAPAEKVYVALRASPCRMSMFLPLHNVFITRLQAYFRCTTRRGIIRSRRNAHGPQGTPSFPVRRDGRWPGDRPELQSAPAKTRRLRRRNAGPPVRRGSARKIQERVRGSLGDRGGRLPERRRFDTRVDRQARTLRLHRRVARYRAHHRSSWFCFRLRTAA